LGTIAEWALIWPKRVLAYGKALQAAVREDPSIIPSLYRVLVRWETQAATQAKLDRIVEGIQEIIASERPVWEDVLSDPTEGTAAIAAPIAQQISYAEEQKCKNAIPLFSFYPQLFFEGAQQPILLPFTINHNKAGAPSS